MAMMSTDIMIRLERRPIWLDGKEKGLFHCWSQRAEIVPPSIAVGGHTGGVVSGVLAIIEMEDGTVKGVYPERIKFADGGDFNFLHWKERVEN